MKKTPQPYRIVGINPPGRASVKLNGFFKEVNLYDLNQDELKDLHQQGIPYVQQTAEGFKETNPQEKEISVKTVGAKSTKRTKKY